MKFFILIFITIFIACSGGGTDIPNVSDSIGSSNEVSLDIDGAVDSTVISEEHSENTVDNSDSGDESVDSEDESVDSGAPSIDYGDSTSIKDSVILDPDMDTISDETPDFGDAFTVDTLIITEDSLFVFVGYGGGCESHDFNMNASLELDSLYTIYVTHNANGDMCEMYVNQKLAYSLEDDFNVTNLEDVSFTLLNNNVTYRYEIGE